MLNSPVLDLVILLSFTFFIGSLILSAVNEAIAGLLRLRPKQLQSAIETLFFTTDWKDFVQKQFVVSPHIQSLTQKNNRYPAYIPAKSFVLAIVEQFRKAGLHSPRSNVEYKTGMLSASIAKNSLKLPECMKNVLLDFAKQVEALYPGENKQIEEFEKRIEGFYNSAMDRAGGWYKKKVRTILLVLGLMFSVALNVDTIKIANDALADKQRLSKAVDNISANMEDIGQLKSFAMTDTSIEVTHQTVLAAGPAVRKIRIEYERTAGYSLGYKNFDEFTRQWRTDFLKKLLGVIITAVAVQLGSNFWFDLMNKAVNIRAAGKRPDEKRPPVDTATS